MFMFNNRWIKEAWKQEAREESIMNEMILTMQTKGNQVKLQGEI